jgi:uncharacterized protein YndB with AHSA1/START domain
MRIERTLPASPHRVNRAWLEPELIRRWMAPGSYEVTRVEVDERVGGRYRIWQASAGVPVGGFECEILQLVPDERIAWRWGFAGAGPGVRAGGVTLASILAVLVPSRFRVSAGVPAVAG